MKSIARFASTLLALSLTATTAFASTLNQTFMNDYSANALYFWSDDSANLQFGAVRFDTGMSAWSVQSSSGSTLVLSGDVVAAGKGRFTLQLDYGKQPFSMQWAEVFFDSGISQILGAGTLSYSKSGWVGTSVFTHGADIPYQFTAQTAVPLPSSVVLLLSSVLCLPLRRLLRVPLRA